MVRRQRSTPLIHSASLDRTTAVPGCELHTDTTANASSSMVLYQRDGARGAPFLGHVRTIPLGPGGPFPCAMHALTNNVEFSVGFWDRKKPTERQGLTKPTVKVKIGQRASHFLLIQHISASTTWPLFFDNTWAMSARLAVEHCSNSAEKA